MKISDVPKCIPSCSLKLSLNGKIWHDIKDPEQVIIRIIRLHEQIEETSHKCGKLRQLRWLIRYRNFYIQQHKNPSWR